MSGTEQQYYYSDDHSRCILLFFFPLLSFIRLFAAAKISTIIIFLPEALRKAGANTTYTSYYTFYSNIIFKKKVLHLLLHIIIHFIILFKKIFQYTSSVKSATSTTTYTVKKK